MDTTYLYRLGTVAKNLRNIIRDRGYTCELDLITDDAFETAGLLYRRSMQTKLSLGTSLRTIVKHKTLDKYLCIWPVDRNYDPLKLRERMTSTDQIKAINEDIAALKLRPETCSHIVVCPTKCSPQARKEILACCEVFLFDQLLIDLPRHVQVSPHKVISEALLKEFLGKSVVAKDLPRITQSDPIAKWYAWPVGTIIYVDNPVMPKFRIVSE